MNASLISIRPRFVDAIFSGDKWIELRRRHLQMGAGRLLFVYETAPIMAIRGIVRVSSVEAGSVRDMWSRVAEGAHVTKREYQGYFDECDRAFAVHLVEPQAFAEPLTLSEIRATSPLFHPPRTWTSFMALPLPLQVRLRACVQALAPEWYRGSRRREGTRESAQYGW